MRYILARLVWHFDLERPPGVDPPQWAKQSIYWFWEKQATHVQIRHAN